jgi:hypothetical protein
VRDHSKTPAKQDLGTFGLRVELQVRSTLCTLFYISAYEAVIWSGMYIEEWLLGNVSSFYSYAKDYRSTLDKVIFKDMKWP